MPDPKSDSEYPLIDKCNRCHVIMPQPYLFKDGNYFHRMEGYYCGPVETFEMVPMGAVSTLRELVDAMRGKTR